MTRVILDLESVAKLRWLAEPAEICDQSGAVIGIYAPITGRELYQGADSPASEYELRQSELEPARPWRDILRDLEARS